MRRNANLWVGIFFLIVSLIFLVNSFTYSYISKLGGGIGPAFLPRWCGLFLCIASIAYIILAVKKNMLDFSEILPDKDGIKNVGKLFFYIALFSLLVNYTGFIVANSIMLFLMFRGYFKLLKNLIISVCISIFLHFVFVVWLTLPLPANIFGW